MPSRETMSDRPSSIEDDEVGIYMPEPPEEMMRL